MIKEQPDKPRDKLLPDTSAAWLPPPYELADISALQAVQAGSASAEQQKRALNWIIHQAAGTYDFPYRPGANDRDTNIALGRQFVGQQIVKLLHLNAGVLRRNEPNADSHEPT